MKEYVWEGKVETTNQLTSYVGILFADGGKGVILNFGTDTTGRNRYHIITNNGNYGNCYYGDIYYDGETIMDTVESTLTGNVKVYCFDSYKEMMTWFVDGIRN